MSAYCETCAAIGNVYVNHRLFLLHGDSRYYDVAERTLYNGLISGVALDGGGFFYPNPLESMGQHQRQPWFGCACCPSNIARFIPSLPGYVYAVKDNDVYVNLFMSNNANLDVNGKQVAISQQTNYPSEWTHSSHRRQEQGRKLRSQAPHPRMGEKQTCAQRSLRLQRRQAPRLFCDCKRTAGGRLTHSRRLLHHRTQLEEGRQSGTPPRHGYPAQSKPTTRLKPTVAE